MPMPRRTPLPGWRETKWKDRRGQIHVAYYFEHPINAEGDRPRTPLGTDKVAALLEYGKLTKKNQSQVGLEVSDFSVRALYKRHLKWMEDRETSGLSLRTIGDRKDYWKQLEPVFGDCHIDSLTSPMMLHYYEARSSKSSAKKEVKYLSVMCGWCKAREWMKEPNPVTKDVLREMKVQDHRDVYVTDGLYWLVYDCADWLVQDTLEFAVLNYLRPAEALKPAWTTVHRVGEEEEIWHTLPKTRKSGVRIKRVRVAGRLKALFDRIRARPVVGRTILCDEKGQALRATGTLRYRFYKARNAAAARIRALQGQHGDAWLIERGLPIPPPLPPEGEPDNWLKDLIQIRDMRPKAATDSERRDGMPATRDRLGHTTEKQTADYVRDMAGKLVDPGVVDRPHWLDELKAAS